MRRTLSAAFLLTPAAALIVSACVGDAPATGDDTQTADGSTTDATSNADGAVGDGSIPIDAGPPCTGTWCTCGTPAKSAFCDDFDRTGEKLAQGWSYDGSFASTADGGTLKLSADAETPPHSMFAMVKADNFAQLTEALTETLSDKPSTIAFDLLLDGAGGNCSGTTMTFAQLGFDSMVKPGPSSFVRFSTVNGVPDLGLMGNGPETRIDGDASLPATWVRVRMTASVGVIDGGLNGVTANVYVTPPGSDDSADASVLLSGSVQITTSTAASWLSIGVLNVENTNSCGVYIDNVAIYQ